MDGNTSNADNANSGGEARPSASGRLDVGFARPDDSTDHQ